jgi:hypothetical protein
VARPQLAVLGAADTPYRPPVFDRLGRANAQADVAWPAPTAAQQRRRLCASYFVPQMDGLGLEVMELCLPQMVNGQLTGYVVATYSLGEMLANLVGQQLTRSQEVSFTEADGTRLALYGSARRGSRVFTAQQLLDLPGNTLVLRLDSWRGAPEIFPNVLTALVTATSIALLAVLFLLGKDTRRRLRGRAGPGRGAGVPQGDGGFAGHRPARARPARPHHLRQPGVLRDGGLLAGGAAGPRHAGAVLAARTGGRIPEAAGGAAGRASSRRRAKASNRCSCARTARASRC